VVTDNGKSRVGASLISLYLQGRTSYTFVPTPGKMQERMFWWPESQDAGQPVPLESLKLVVEAKHLPGDHHHLLLARSELMEGPMSEHFTLALGMSSAWPAPLLPQIISHDQKPALHFWPLIWLQISSVT
jgi:hypothetical protein